MEAQWAQAVRALQEYAFLLQNQAKAMRAEGRTATADQFLAKAREAEERAQTMYELQGSWAVHPIEPAAVTEAHHEQATPAGQRDGVASAPKSR